MLSQLNYAIITQSTDITHQDFTIELERPAKSHLMEANKNQRHLQRF